MATKMQLVRLAIEKPIHNFIFRDRDFEYRNCYYGRSDLSAAYIKAVVEFPPMGTGGILVTAFPADNVKDGEVLIWP